MISVSQFLLHNITHRYLSYGLMLVDHARFYMIIEKSTIKLI